MKVDKYMDKITLFGPYGKNAENVVNGHDDDLIART